VAVAFPNRLALTDRVALAPAGVGSRWVWLSRFFLWLVLLQGFHFLEHCVQLVQRFGLHDPNGNGLLGNVAGLNFELLHVGYNTLYLAGVLGVYSAVSLTIRPRWARPRLVVGFLAAAVAVQGYHEVEHLVRAGEIVGLLSLPPAADPTSPEPPGLLGQWINGTLVHWALNGIVEALPLGAFVLGNFRDLLNPVRRI
jgi:hypothetical protein